MSAIEVECAEINIYIYICVCVMYVMWYEGGFGDS